MAMAAITVHAPVLSIFISSIRSDGLMLMPPESKQTPLPTIARWRSSASRSPSPPERMTIIRGGLSLPRPTAMNMPIPSSVARSGSMTSIHRPCCSAIARASSARTAGLTSLAARLESVRAMFAPSPMIDARARRPRVSAAASAPGRDEDQLVEDRRRRVDLVAVDRPRVVGALDDAAGDQLGRDRRVRRRGHRRSGVSQIARRLTVRPPSRRSAAAATRTTVSRSSVAGSPRPTARSRPLEVSPPAASAVA